jgi:hypothetical protein
LLSHRSSIMQMNSLKKRDSEGEKERGRSIPTGGRRRWRC